MERLNPKEMVLTHSPMNLFRTLAMVGLVGVGIVSFSHLNAQPPSIKITQQSIKINDIEIRTAHGGFISLPTVETLIGKPQDIYLAGLGVRVYSWTRLGIHIQEGWREPEKNKLFKLQVLLTSSYDTIEDKHTESYKGKLQVEGVVISQDLSVESIRKELKEVGFKTPENPWHIAAQKGHITIFTDDTSNKFERVDAWCP